MLPLVPATVKIVKKIIIVKASMIGYTFLVRWLSRVRWRFCKAKYYLTLTTSFCFIIESGVQQILC